MESNWNQVCIGGSLFGAIAIYDDGSSEFSYDLNPTKDGTLSPAEQWVWDGQAAIWNSQDAAISYIYEKFIHMKTKFFPFFCLTVTLLFNFSLQSEIIATFN